MGVFKNRWKLIFITSFLVAFIVYVAVSIASRYLEKPYEMYEFISIGSVGGKPLDLAASLDNLIHADSIIIGINEKNKARVKCGEVAGLIKITVRANSPERTKELMGKVTSYVLKREEFLLAKAKAELEISMGDIKFMMKGSSIYVSLMDPSVFKFKETRLDAVSQVDVAEDWKNQKKKFVLATFAFVFIITSLIAFYMEGRKRNGGN